LLKKQKTSRKNTR